jgi:hypothetical protein
MPTTLFTPTALQPFTIILQDDLTIMVGGPSFPGYFNPALQGGPASEFPMPALANTALATTGGGLVVAEQKLPVTTAVLYTVPANKVFTGVVAMVASATTANMTISAAVGGTLLQFTAPSVTTGITQAEAVAVTVSNGASTDAITVNFAAGKVLSAIAVGYI